MTLRCVSFGSTLRAMSMKLLQEKLDPLGHEAFILGKLPPLPKCGSLLLAPELYNWQQGLCKRRRSDTSLLVNWILELYPSEYTAARVA